MRKSFFICLLINIVFNFEFAIPSIILLGLHFWLDISIWWSIGAFLLFIAGIIIWMLIIGWAGKLSNIPDKPKVNKNPYSSGPYKSLKDKNNNQ